MRRVIAVVAVLVSVAAHAAIVAGPERGVSAPGFGRAFGSHKVLAVASDGTNFLVAWQNDSPGNMTFNLSLVGRDGSPLVVPSTSLGTVYVNGASIVWTGDAFLVAWSESGQTSMKVVRVGEDGTVTLAADVANAVVDEIAWNGSHALVAYRSFPGEHVALLDEHGAVLRDVALTSTFPRNVAVTSSGDRFVVAWVEDDSRTSRINAASIDDNANITATRVIVPDSVDYLESMDMSGSALVWVDVTRSMHRIVADPITLAVQTLPAIAVSSPLVRLASSGTDVFAYWTLSRANGLFLETLRFDGSALHETQISNSFTTDLRVAASNESLFAAWTNGNQELNGALLDSQATFVKRTDFPVAISRLAQSAPAIASAGDVSLVAWIDLKDTMRGDLVAERVDSRGVAMDAQPFVIDTGVPYWSPISAGYTGQVWVVAHARDENARRHDVLQRVGRDGAVIDDVPREVGFDINSFASNGTVSLFAGSSPTGVRAVRLNGAGDVIDEIAVSSHIGYSVGVAAAADEFLVAWSEGSDFSLFPGANLRDVLGTRLDANGSPIDVAPIAIANMQNDEADPHVASDGRDFVVLYVDHQGSLVEGTLRARRVLHEGVAAELSAIASNVITSSIGRVDGRYVVAYRAGNSVLAVTLGDQGSVLDLPIVVDNAPINFRDPVAASPTSALFGYSRNTDVMRAFVRPLTLAPVPPRGRGVRH